jgi:hypothetical protein
MKIQLEKEIQKNIILEEKTKKLLKELLEKEQKIKELEAKKEEFFFSVERLKEVEQKNILLRPANKKTF